MKISNLLLITAISLCGQGTLTYLPLNPVGGPQVAKWTVANSGSNFSITPPVGSATTVAKAAATTQSVTIFALPANSVILSCTIKTGTAFTGTTTLTATVGITGALTACVSTPYDMKAAVAAGNFSAPLTITPIINFAGINFILALTSTVDNLSSISAGSLTIYLTYLVLP